MYSFGRTKTVVIVAIALLTGTAGVLLMKNSDNGGFFEILAAGADDSLLAASTLDSDGDGLADALEAEIGTNPYLIDTDNDGYTDEEEVSSDHDPLRAENEDYLDIDQDGLTGIDEARYGTNPRSPDTDVDGVPDGTEIVQGTDPGHASFSSLPDYLGANVAEQRQEELYPAFNPDSLAQIEDLSNAETLDGFSSMLSPIVGDVDESETFSNGVSEVKISDRTDQAFVTAYFNRIGLTVAKHSPVLDQNQLAAYASTHEAFSKESRADMVRKLEGALADLSEIEAPNDPEIVSLHQQALDGVSEGLGIAREMERMDLASPSTVQRMSSMMTSTQRVIGTLKDEIFPKARSVAERYKFDLPESFAAFLN